MYSCLIKKDKYNDTIEARCPFCGYSSEDIVNDSDYGIYTMTYCINCDGEGFLNYKIDTAIPVEYLIETTADDIKVYSVPLLEIKRATGTRLIMKSRDLLDEEAREVFQNEEIPRDLLEKYGLTLPDDFDGVIEVEEKYIVEHGLDHLLTLPVNSYNLHNPEVPYPKGFDLSHDGRYVWVLLKNDIVTYISGD